MRSTILTKVNTVTPRNFAQQCEWMSVDKLHTQDDFAFLQLFVSLCHKVCATVPMPTAGSVDAHTGRGSYRYTIYQKHIVRMDLNSLKKKYHQIS